VRWIATRQESFLSDTQGRDHLTRAELGLDADGVFWRSRFTPSRISAPTCPASALRSRGDLQRIAGRRVSHAQVFVEVTGVFSNSVPTDAYRGAGRPEACYVLERLADKAALELASTGGDQAAQSHPGERDALQDTGRTHLRLRRFPKGVGAGARDVRLCEEASRRPRHRHRLLRRIVGVAPSRLAGMMGARVGFYESAQFGSPDGSLTAYLGTHNHGQGHATTYAQILSSQLGVPLERISIVEGDTAAVPVGTGTFGSRSIAVGGSALHVAGAKIIAGKRIAAHLLEAAASDIEFAGGAFRVAGTDRKVSFPAVAGAAYVRTTIRFAELEPGLDRMPFTTRRTSPSPMACTSARWRWTPRRETVRIVGYWAVDDIGTVINPMIVEGQLHAAVAQGLGQALTERTVYEEGQLLSASFMDYALPRASDVPFLRVRAGRKPALHAQPARRERMRGGRHHCRTGRGDQRRARCVALARRARHRDAR